MMLGNVWTCFKSSTRGQSPRKLTFGLETFEALLVKWRTVQVFKAQHSIQIKLIGHISWIISVGLSCFETFYIFSAFIDIGCSYLLSKPTANFCHFVLIFLWSESNTRDWEYLSILNKIWWINNDVSKKKNRCLSGTVVQFTILNKYDPFCLLSIKFYSVY